MKIMKNENETKWKCMKYRSEEMAIENRREKKRNNINKEIWRMKKCNNESIAENIICNESNEMKEEAIWKSKMKMQ